MQSIPNTQTTSAIGLGSRLHRPVLPTLDRLGVSLQPDVDVYAIAKEWFSSFTENVSTLNIDQIVELFLEDGCWRDMLALTWEFRTFWGTPKIRTSLQDLLPTKKLSSFELGDVKLQQPYPDFAWIRAIFNFETDVGICSGVFRLVPTAGGPWKAYVVYTNLDGLKGFPEKIGPHRNFLPDHGKWKESRARECSFVDAEPTVVVIGGGHSGLEIAARLKVLDISTLVLEKHARIGDNWRLRYQALCLHNSAYTEHFPYLPYPPTWPAYTPALKLAGWLEQYAKTMELNIWTSTTVTNVRPREDGKWDVTVRAADGAERIICTTHVITALGWGGAPLIPTIPGQDVFTGQVLHSARFTSAREHVGKKVIVVGACTSAHDIAADFADNNIDVTLYQRSSTYVMSVKEGLPHHYGLYWENPIPVETADLLGAATPTFIGKELDKRLTATIAEVDKDMLEGLRQVGFKLNFGDEGSGVFYLLMTRAGGYYLDVGTCQKIIDGQIKLKNDSQIECFTRAGLRFTDGSELQADLVVFATGYQSVNSAITELVGEELGAKIAPIWNLTDEGEIRGAWRYLGVPNLWCMMGSLPQSRQFSKHLALQIKAIQEGVYGQRYVA